METAFASDTRRAVALFVAAKIPKEWRYRLLPWAMSFITDLKNLQPIELEGVVKSRVEHFTGMLPNWTSNLRDFGEAGTVKTRTGMTPKLDDRGVICMFVGYAKEHPKETYLMLDLTTRMVKTTRDVIFLGRMYFPDEDRDAVHVVRTVPAWEGVNVNLDFDESDAETDPVPPAVTAGGPAAVDAAVDAADEGADLNEDDVDIDVDVDEQTGPAETGPVQQTRSGRAVRPPARFADFAQLACERQDDPSWTQAELNYFREMHELVELADDMAFVSLDDELVLHSEEEWTTVKSSTRRFRQSGNASVIAPVEQDSNRFVTLVERNTNCCARFAEDDDVDIDGSGLDNYPPLEQRPIKPLPKRTRSKRRRRYERIKRLVDSVEVEWEILRAAELDHVHVLDVSLVGAADGTVNDTNDLRVMKYEEAMRVDPVGWAAAVVDEYKRMMSSKVFVVIPRAEVPRGRRVISTTWAMKQKANGTKRARLVARGFQQVAGDDYDPDGGRYAPVVSLICFKVCCVLILTMRMFAHIVDVRGAFLTGDLSDNPVYIDIPKGMEDAIQKDLNDEAAKTKTKPMSISGCVLMLLKSLYGLVQSSHLFWRKQSATMIKNLKLERSTADYCLYYKWLDDRLFLSVNWVDDIIMACSMEAAIWKRSESCWKL